MANQNVRFYFGSLDKYLALTEKNPLALYFVEDQATGYRAIYKGDQLMAVGGECNELYPGLLTPEEKQKIAGLTANSGIEHLQSLDGSIKITDTDDGRSLNVAVSTQEGNTLTSVGDGLFVPEVILPEYAIEKQAVADEGYSVTYKLKKTVDGVDSYIGDAINLSVDLVLDKAELKVVEEANVPYDGALVGELYLAMSFNDADKTEIHVPMKGLVDTYTAGSGIEVVDNKIGVKLAAVSNGLAILDEALTLNLATTESNGAMSKEDKAFIGSIPTTYTTKAFANHAFERIKYEIVSKPNNTLVSYRDQEIRIMCPEDTQWELQNVGATGNSNMYYMGFKAYAPDGAVSFKEGDQGAIVDEMLDFNGDFAGTDEYGRNYSICWLALASYNASTDTWTYFGQNSSVEKYIGWTYVVEWYDENGHMIESDQVRINLANEDCYNAIQPYYLNNFATVEQVTKLEQTMVWAEIVEY